MIKLKLVEALGKVEDTKGLPKGDTYLSLPDCEAEPYDYVDDKTGNVTKKWKITTKEGTIYYLPLVVMRDIKKLFADSGTTKVRVTRTGEKLDTRYTVVKA